MNTMILFHYDASGNVQYTCSESSFEPLSIHQRTLLHLSLTQTAGCIKEFSTTFYQTLLKKPRMQLRITDDIRGASCLLPHEILLNAALFECEKTELAHRRRMLIGILYRMLYHWCNPELHVTQVRFHTLGFLQRHKDILASTVFQLKTHAPLFDEADWIESLCQIDTLLMLDDFWLRLGSTPSVRGIYASARGSKTRVRARIKHLIQDAAKSLRSYDPQKIKLLTSYKWIFIDDDAMVLVYALPDNLLKVIRLCRSNRLDSMSADFACRSIRYEDIRTDLFHDHGHWIRNWVHSLQAQAKDPSLKQLEQMLLSDDLHAVRGAISQLVNKIRRKDNLHPSYRLLYSALYYWNNLNKGMCRSICLEVSAILEDILTERPPTFPPSQTNRSVFRTETATVEVQIPKPRNVRKDNFKARLLWSVNGRRKMTLPMQPTGRIQPGGNMTFSVDFPV